MGELEPAAVYRQRVAHLSAALARRERAARRNGNINLVLFFAAAAVLTVGAVRSEASWYWLAGGLGIAFVAALAQLRRAQRAAAHAATLLALNQEGLARLERKWAALPAPARLPSLPGDECAIDSATAADLDLLGPASLQHLLNTPATPAGQATLHAWLLRPAPPAVVRERQAAARELAPQLDLRDAQAAQARQMGEAQEHYERFIAWAESAPWLARQPLLVWAARLLPLLALALGIAAWQQPPALAALPLYPLLGVTLLAILVLALTAGNRAAATIGQVAAQQEVFVTYAGLFDMLERQSFTAPALRRLQSELGERQKASQQMRRLQWLMPLASIRQWLLFLPVELFTLWNIHLLWLLERWQTQAGGQARGWLAALGKWEALAAIATLHHDHPAWCFPTLAEGEPSDLRVEAANLAHPLLPPASAVGNDLAVGPPGSFLLVTGSNMSGKSTLLRAIGLNCVLAQLGAPACAARLHLPPLLVASSMRVQDSLSQGVSYFLAELQSLKAIVELAERKPAAQPTRVEDAAPLLLYLLDEILQGTNSAERQIAARHVIQRLVASGAIGAVSTHDLALAAAPELTAAAVAVHFTESFAPGNDSSVEADNVAASAAPAMHFDYKLRPGVATSTNALKIMELVGL
jgi:hypothetical protein